MFGFRRKLRLMPSHEDGGNNNKDQQAQTEHEHHPPAQLFGLPTERYPTALLTRSIFFVAVDLCQCTNG